MHFFDVESTFHETSLKWLLTVVPHLTHYMLDSLQYMTTCMWKPDYYTHLWTFPKFLLKKEGSTQLCSLSLYAVASCPTSLPELTYALVAECTQIPTVPKSSESLAFTCVKHMCMLFCNCITEANSTKNAKAKVKKVKQVH